MTQRINAQVSHLNMIIDAGDVQCVVNLRMNRNAFGRLCYLLMNVGGLTDSRYVRVQENVAMFLSILAHHKKNRVTSHDYMRSGQTISSHFHDVMRALMRLYPLFLVKPSPVDENCDNDSFKWFQGCLGALDGTLVSVHVPAREKAKYRTRKGTIAVNVLGVCDINMNFVYALIGWEGSAADARVLRDALTRDDLFKVPRGNMLTTTVLNFVEIVVQGFALLRNCCVVSNGNGFRVFWVDVFAIFDEPTVYLLRVG